jgi:hypothetical protein
VEEGKPVPIPVELLKELTPVKVLLAESLGIDESSPRTAEVDVPEFVIGAVTEITPEGPVAPVGPAGPVGPVAPVVPVEPEVLTYARLVQEVEPLPILNLLVSDSQPISPARSTGFTEFHSAAVPLFCWTIIDIF